MIVEITAENSDPDFASVDSETVTGTVLDDDVPGFEITQSNTFVIVDENGTTDTFTIVLTAEPLSNVILTLESTDTGEATVTETLTFTLRLGHPTNSHRNGVDDPIIDKPIPSRNSFNLL